MNATRNLYWKVGYILAIAVLWYPLHWLCEPATRNSEGGELARLRTAYGLSEKNIGEIDASAETVKLSTLGLRGVAVNILWNKANEYKMKENWSEFGAVLTQISNLEPHFYSVWNFQAHNLTYNTSVEFDDYNVRYYWVIRGIEFLKTGWHENQHDPRFPNDLGWFIGSKIGTADEHRQYRRLFKHDDEFHKTDDLNPNRRMEDRDNWLVSYEYYKQAQKQVQGYGDRKGDILKTTPLLFYSHSMMMLIKYSEELESDSTAGETPRFGDVAQAAWRHADNELEAFGRRDLVSTDNIIVHLSALEGLKSREKELEKQLEELLPGEFNKLKTDRIKEYLADQRVALDTAFDKRNPGQETYVIEHWNDVADGADAARRPKARKLAAELSRLEAAVRGIRSDRDIVNYTYWKTRCEAEPTPEALLARELMYKAGQEQIEARPTEAKKLYEQSFAQWRKVLDQFSVLREDSLMAEDLRDVVDKYRDCLRQLSGADANFPDPFVLQDMLDLAERMAPRPQAASPKKPDSKTGEKKPETTKPGDEKPVEKKTPEKKPVEKKPDGKQPDAAKPASGKSATDKSTPATK